MTKQTAKIEEVTQESSSSTEVAVMDQYEQSFLMEQQRMLSRISAAPFKRVQIVQESDYQADLGDGTVLDIPFGSFHIVGTSFHGKKATFRPLIEKNKLMRRAGVADNYKVIGESIYFSDWKDNIYDTMGTTKCGRKWGKDLVGLDETEVAVEKAKGKYHVEIFGLMKLDGMDQYELVALRLGGTKSLRWGNATRNNVIRSLITQREFTLELVSPKNDPTLTAAQKLEAPKNTANLLVTPDMSKLLPLTDIQKEAGIIAKFIAEHNQVIIERHLEAKARRDAGEYEDDGVLDVEFEEVGVDD